MTSTSSSTPTGRTRRTAQRYLDWLEALVNGHEAFGMSDLVLTPSSTEAALAMESGCEWITTDRGFSRYPGLRWRHPFQ